MAASTYGFVLRPMKRKKLGQSVSCRDCHLALPPDDTDVMIVDPPFSKHVHKSATSHSFGKNGRGVRKRDLGFGHITPSLRRYIATCAGRVKRWSVIFTDVESVGLWKKALGKLYVRSIPWVRWSMPQLSGDRPPQGCEMVVLAHPKGRKRWSGPGNLTHLAHKCLRGAGKHKAEKPLDQMLDLVSWFSEPGELVYDPCAGSGTVGLACRILGRRYVGVELQRVWAKHAQRRLKAPLSPRDQVRYDRWQASKVRYKYTFKGVDR